ncbi:MAG: proline--tRNA ligase [Actinobacteria bacterium]|nr:proline--tRNA ligase [Actinomycetota bacterium]
MSLPDQSVDFPGWYQEVVKRAEMAENSVTRGAMVIKPYGYAIWEFMQQGMDRRIKETGHQNLYFPLLYPLRLLEKEADHVEGFTPQVAIVTHAGGSKLEEPLVIRPTSEAVIWATYKNWIQSYRDLPLLYNQWANVLRWEMRPRLFLRTTEFLWQEGHTAHETEQEAMAESKMILSDVYRTTVEEDFAMPVIPGRKSASERFPGAQETFTIEALMRDGKALQAGTSHYFGQNFSRAYDVKFQSRDGTEEHPYSTSWGASSRLIGGVVMVHGDEKGLRLPPKLAPYQVVVVPIYKGDQDKAKVLDACNAVAKMLDGLRVKIDDREHFRPGYKFNEWELKGVPVRLEIGAREVDADEVVVYRRDLGEKQTERLAEVGERANSLMAEIQSTLFDQAEVFRDEHTHVPESYEEFNELLSSAAGFVRAPWCGEAACEEKVKAETKATNRALTLEPEAMTTACIVCNNDAKEMALWAQAY